MPGYVEAICLGPTASAPMQVVEAAELVAGVGLLGDRYATRGSLVVARTPEADAREVTLFEAETLDWLASEHGLSLAVHEHRRNVTTRGIDLLSLVGRQFTIGPVHLEGVRPCPPCAHLQKLTAKPVLRPLVGRGGLRARIVVGGTIRRGDQIVVDASCTVPTPGGIQAGGERSAS